MSIQATNKQAQQTNANQTRNNCKKQQTKKLNAKIIIHIPRHPHCVQKLLLLQKVIILSSRAQMSCCCVLAQIGGWCRSKAKESGQFCRSAVAKKSNKKASTDYSESVNSYILQSTAVTKGHFIAWIEAKYEQSTDQEFHYLSFDLANSFYKNCNISKTISARRSDEVSKSKQRNPPRYL